MQTQKLVLVGNGMAGIRTLEELLKIAPGKYDITVFGAEPHPNYNRILLSPVLAGERTVQDIVLNGMDWYEENQIHLHLNKKITKIDRKKRVVFAEDGTSAEYDRLLLSTGSTPFILPIPGAELPGVVSFRDISDVDAMLDASSRYRHAVVIGGGLLGLEAANGLKLRGMDVTVVHLSPWLMDRQLDEPAARLLQKNLEAKGLKFLLEKQTGALVPGESGRVCAVNFKDGESIPADLVVMAVGIRPNTELAESAGLYCNRGIVVNDTLQTFDPRIYSVGECVSHRGVAYGLVAPLFEQAKVAANHLAEFGIGRYTGSLTSTKLKVTGIDLFSAGDYVGAEGTESIVLSDPAGGNYRKVVLKDNKVMGAVLYGDTMDGSWYFNLLREGKDVSEFRSSILFGQPQLGDSGHGDPHARVAAMPDSAEICGCNGICKGDIVKAIRDKKLFTLDDVRAHTKASSSCGSCTGLVESLLAVTVGGDYSTAPSKKPLCACTEHSHDEVRETISREGIKSIPALMHFMEWKTPDGCNKCRTALNYYLLCAWPSEYVDDNQSRYINERVHANIQKDGTYSVIPRIFGGDTSPKQLMAIAQIAERWEVPTVKFTGGQRLDLLGIRKEQLPGIWKDLSDAGFVSGHAYGKAMRTVKTCVGSQWCRFGTQDSTRMGIKLEELTWGSWTPHKFKLAVSGCPRNCAEATIKDFGVVAVDSGWELHVGGNGGIKVRATDFLCHVKTEEEVLEYCAAFMQVYREDAHYLERTAPWVERRGLAFIKERVVDDADQRKAYATRFYESQKYAQDDPWKARGEGVDAHEYQPMATLV